jgi:DNA polymerase III delta prime subunit
MFVETLWVEKYRPKTLADCVLPSRLKKTFTDIVKSGEIPNLLLCGSAGVGKTTIARAISSDLNMDVLFINASLENGIDVLRSRISQFASSMSLTGNKKLVVLDEADNMTTALQTALRGFIEEFSKNCRFVLTCNFPQKIITPLHSRCSVIDFTLRDKEEKIESMSLFFKRICTILELENVEFDKKILATIVNKYYPDFRRLINELERCTYSGKLDEALLVNFSEKLFLDLVSYLKDKSFSSMRKWVGENSNIESAELFRKLYDFSADVLKPESIPQLILLLADYQYKDAFVIDKEINRVACLTEIMVSCEFKKGN